VQYPGSLVTGCRPRLREKQRLTGCVFDHVERTTMNIIHDWGTDVNLDRRLRRRGPIQNVLEGDIPCRPV
jgi:hypothetical protein